MKPEIFPDLDLYNEVFKICNSLNLPIHNVLDVKNKKYPFISIQDVQFVPFATKSHYLGTAYVTVDLYDLIDNKKQQSINANNILLKLMKLKKSKYYNWLCNINTCSVRYIVDTSTSNTLTHAIVTVEMKLR